MLNQHCDGIRRCRNQHASRSPELTRAQYQADRPSMPSPLVNTAMVRAHARKMINAWSPWIMFFTRPGLAEGRGSFMMRVGLNRHGRSLESNVCFVTRQKVCPLRKQRRCDRRGSEGKEEERRRRVEERTRREEAGETGTERVRGPRQQPEPHFFVRATLLHSTLFTLQGYTTTLCSTPLSLFLLPHPILVPNAPSLPTLCYSPLL